MLGENHGKQLKHKLAINTAVGPTPHAYKVGRNKQLLS